LSPKREASALLLVAKNALKKRKEKVLKAISRNKKREEGREVQGTVFIFLFLSG